MNIKISKNAHSCAACGNDFQHEQELTSVVKVAEGVLHRQDFCRDCWHAEQNKEAYSVWSMVYHDSRIENQAPPEVFSPLRQLFYEAAEEESRIEMAKAFLAAGLLRRQKVFRLIKESDESDGDVRITLYTDRIGNRLIEVPDPQFTYAEMDKARTLLIERLQVLEQAAAAAAAPEPPASPAPQGDAEMRVKDALLDGDDPDSSEHGHENEDEVSAIQEGSIDAEEEEEFDDEEEEFDDDDDEFDDDDEDDDDEDEDEDDDEDDDEDVDVDVDVDDDEDDDEDETENENEEKEVHVMKSALAGNGREARFHLADAAYAYEEALHAQA